MKEFNSLVEADAYFQKEFKLLEQGYEKKKETLYQNSEVVIFKLKERYEGQVKGLQEATQIKLANLVENSEKARNQIKLVTEQRKQQLKAQLEATFDEKKRLLTLEAEALFKDKEVKVKELHMVFVEEQNAVLLDAVSLEQLREDYVENFNRVNEEFEDTIGQLAETLDELEEALHDELEDKLEELDETLESNLDRLSDQEIDAKYDIKEAANDEERRLYEEYVEREQELQFRFSNEEIKIENDYEDRLVELQIEQRKVFAQFD